MKHRIHLALVCVMLLASSCGGEDSPATSAPATTGAPTTLVSTTPAPTTTAAPTTTTTTTTPASTTEAPTVSTVTTTTLPELTPAQEAFLTIMASGGTQRSGRAEAEVRMTGVEGAVDGAEVAFGFTMAFDPAAGVTSWVMDLSSLVGLADPDDPELAQFEELFGVGVDGLFTEIEMRQIGDTAYMRFPFFTLLLGVETEWVSFPAEDMAAAEGLAPVAPVNPADLLDGFQGAIPAVTEVGTETLRGVEVVHYLVEFDVAAMAQSADPTVLDQLGDFGDLPFEVLPMDIWVSEDGTIHRLAMYLDASGLDLPPGEAFGSMELQFDMFDQGEPIEVVAPPADQVTDGSQLLGFLST